MSISMFELIVIFLIALLLWGPKDLLRMSHSIGYLWGKWQRYCESFYYQVQKELNKEDEKAFEEESKADNQSPGKSM